MANDFPYKTVLITGGTGTFAHAMVRYLLDNVPEIAIRLLSRDEYKQQVMAREFFDARLRFLLGDVRDVERLKVACQGVSLVLHGAALKHIEKGEYDPLEFVATNVWGTANVVAACHAAGVEQAILLSTDKSVHAINVYGSTKALAERIFVQGQHYAPHGTRFAVVRYGNIMGSRGSVIEVWQQAIQQHKPLILTDARMSRFWMQSAEAVRLVLWTALQKIRGGVVVPHLPAFHMIDLAKAMLPDGLDYQVSGVRPGEKLAEDLMTIDEQQRAYWYAPSEQVPCLYLVPPAIQHWETPVVGTGWQPPPVPCLTGAVAGSPGPLVAYNSAAWQWRLGVEDLRQRLEQLHKDA